MTERYDDEQGTRIEKKEPTGAGAEATEGTGGTADSNSHEHHSGYGGKGGTPKQSNGTQDIPRSRR